MVPKEKTNEMHINQPKETRWNWDRMQEPPLGLSPPGESDFETTILLSVKAFALSRSAPWGPFYFVVRMLLKRISNLSQLDLSKSVCGNFFLGQRHCLRLGFFSAFIQAPAGWLPLWLQELGPCLPADSHLGSLLGGWPQAPACAFS